ncbi:hypothetical protein IAT40_001886 [Kwoniella sp. CBS 6097]
MPTNADIRRKNANFAARAQAGKRTVRPPRSATKRSVGTWVLIAMGFLLVGGTALEVVEAEAVGIPASIADPGKQYAT